LGKYLFILATLGFTIFGQLIIKARAEVHSGAAAAGRIDYLQAMFLDPFVWAGLIGAVVASACWMLAIRGAALGFAYPFMALSFVLVPLGGALLFDEPFGWRNLVSLGLIAGGVALNSLTS
jgi:multidrug transporter EmrE-like cation transporter